VFVAGKEFTIPLPQSGRVSLLGTLPEGYRPNMECSGTVFSDYGASFHCMCWAVTDGKLYCTNETGSVITTATRIAFSFPVK